MRERRYARCVVSELQEVLRAIEEGAARGEQMALATIVSIRGSTYRREGARLLVPKGGATVGTISGGCLEGEVCTVAEEVMDDRRARVLPFDLTADAEAAGGRRRARRHTAGPGGRRAGLAGGGGR